MKKIIITLLLALVAMAGWAKNENETVWSNVVTGYANVPIFKVTRVVMYDDRTDMSLRILIRIKGQQIGFTKGTALKADGKEYAGTGYAIKGSEPVQMGEPLTMPSDTTELVLSFAPLPPTTQKIDFVMPEGLQILNIHSADRLPEGIADTYWRNEATGDWLIGFAPKHVIYENKVQDIASQTEKNDAYTLTLDDGTPIKVGKLKKGRRTIAIGHRKPLVCSPITGAALPDYPTKDLRTGFVDNGYNPSDSVTIVGWLKDMPEQEWKKGTEFVIESGNIFKNDYAISKLETFPAKMDSLGRFSLKMPLLNSTVVRFDTDRTWKYAALEPGKTYFFLNDYKTGQCLWMGDDVRFQNELQANTLWMSGDRIGDEERGKISAMQFKARTDSTRANHMAELQKIIREHPNLSKRYIDFQMEQILLGQGEAMMQAQYAMPDNKLPQTYLDYVGQELWPKVGKPYTLHTEFKLFQNDLLHHLVTEKHGVRVKEEYGDRTSNYVIISSTDQEAPTLRRYRDAGKLSITDEELATIARYRQEERNFRPDSEDALAEWAEKDFVKQYWAITGREDVSRVLNAEYPLFPLYQKLAILDSLGCDRDLRDIVATNHFWERLDHSREPLSQAEMKYIEDSLTMASAKNLLKAEQQKYIAIENADISKLTSLNAVDVSEMSDGEKILHKLIEPYRGRLILLDVWGTWCGPCKDALSHSQEQYERLKEFDLVYLYLANRSPQESWENVIKEYNVTGENVVHYNLPAEQQSAIERFLRVRSFPSYRLISRDGKVLDVDADPRNLNALTVLLKKLK